MHLRPALFIALALTACSEVEPPKYTELPVAACGMKPYTLLDPATLGTPGEFDEVHLLNVSPVSIAALLKDTEFESLLPVPYGARVFRLRYTTQDRGQKVEATTLVGVPTMSEAPANKIPMTVFLHGTTGFSDPCAPSRDLDNQAPAALFASLGFVSVLPDYIGMNGLGEASTTSHGYLVGEQVALGAWDAVRAARKFIEEYVEKEFEMDSKVVVWGGSQGGHAALFTELYAPYYAPEFEVPGVVALVAPTALLPLTQTAVSTFSPPTLAFASVLTTARRWYGAPADMSGVLTDEAPYNFASTIDSQLFLEGDECNTGDAYKSIGSDPSLMKPETVYRADFIAQTMNALPEPWSCYVRENTLATSSVKPLRYTPTYMAYSELDDLVVTAPMRDEFKRLCSLGYRMQYRECMQANHTEGALWSLPEQLAWVKDRLAGKPLEDVCELHEPVCCEASPEDVCTP